MSLHRHELKDHIGQTVGTSIWFAIHQDRIDCFADATDDHQFIHTDREKAAEGPFGTTIAHGFLSLSMLSAMLYDGGPEIAGEVMSVNYGFDKIRFLSPVPVGARIRACFVRVDVIPRGEIAMDTRFDVTVESDGQEKPTLVANWINRRYFGET